MSRIKGALAFAFIATATLSLAKFDATADFKKFLGTEGPKVAKAFKKKDIKYFQNMSTADFTYKMFNGPADNKAKSMEGLKMMFGMMKSIDMSFKLTSASASGNTGTATFTSTMKGMTLPTPQDKKSHKMVMVAYEKQTWVRSGKTWKLKKIEETKAGTATMDGKPFDPMGGGGH